jgi:uncharacterized protein (DUF983 family)
LTRGCALVVLGLRIFLDPVATLVRAKVIIPRQVLCGKYNAKGSDMADDQSLTMGRTLLRGLRCRCLRCGEGRLFTGFLTLAPRCDLCGLDYSFVDSGDGPAFFVMFISGFIVVASALTVEVLYQPPYWLHAALWLPLILITTIVPLRPAKGLMIALQYHHKAAEGRLSGGDPP